MHGVDVEGKQLGVDEELVRLLGAASPLPVTYAGGVRTLVRAWPSAAARPLSAGLWSVLVHTSTCKLVTVSGVRTLVRA